MALLQKKRSDNNLFPSLQNNFLSRNFFPRFFDWSDGFWNEQINTPMTNIIETDKNFKLEICAPGLKKEDFKIDIDNGFLTVSSEKHEESKSEDKNYRRKEFSYTSFYRSFQLPDNVEETTINAKYDNGMLEIIIPKKELSTSSSKKEIKIA